MILKSEHLEEVSGYDMVSPGLPVLRRIRKYLKPTSAALQWIGTAATKNVLELDEPTLIRLLQGEVLRLTRPCEEGYVFLRVDGAAAGCGLVIEDRLTGQFPRWFREMFGIRRGKPEQVELPE